MDQADLFRPRRLLLKAEVRQGRLNEYQLQRRLNGDFSLAGRVPEND